MRRYYKHLIYLNTFLTISNMGRPLSTENQKKMQPAKDIRWMVHAASVRLVRLRPPMSLLLEYPDAALWDLLTRTDSLEKIEIQLGRIMGWDAQETSNYVASTVERFLADGIVEIKNEV